MRELAVFFAAAVLATAACPVLPLADAVTAAGEPVTERLASRQNRSTRCLFSGETRTLSLTITDHESNAAAYGLWERAQRDARAEDEKFGDGAFSSVDPAAGKILLTAVKGKRIFELWLKGPADEAALGRLRVVMKKWIGKP